jgi:hypothetical protein
MSITQKDHVSADAVAEASPPYADDGLDYAGECPICAAHRDPVTGEERFNAKTIAAIEEGRAMMRGEIPSKLYTSTDEMWEDLMSDDPDDLDD